MRPEDLASSDVVAVLIDLGLADVRSIKSAADRAISDAAEPGERLIELSLVKDSHEALRVLGVTSEFQPPAAAVLAGLTRLRERIERGEIELKEAVDRFYRFAKRRFPPSETIWVVGVRLEDAYADAVDGVFGTIHDVREEFIVELRDLEREYQERAAP